MQPPAAPLIVSWGELVWDERENGEGALSTLGGCACSAALHAAALAANVRLVSAVGDDADGRAARSALEARELAVDWVQTRTGARTARVRVNTSEREPRYAPVARLEWQSIDFEAKLVAALRGADGLMFALFMQGSVVPLGVLRQAFAQSGRPRVVGCDLNLRHGLSAAKLAEVAELVDFVKLNQVESERIADILGIDPARFFLERERGPICVVETRGASGARLTTRERSIEEAAPTVEGGDSVGAGDAFMAAFTLALLEGCNDSIALSRAVTYASAYVVGRRASSTLQNW